MKRIISISLLLIFLSGQFNLTWATQFCDESEVNSLMLGHGFLDCCEGETQSCEDSDDRTDGESFAPPDCCRVDYYSANSDDFFNHIKTLLTSRVLFASAYVNSFIENTFANHHQKFFIAESPPLISDDRQVLLQTFLL